MEVANFEETKVRNANFSGANLREMRAKGTEFLGCDFSKADLSEADLIDAKFDDCNLSGAKLHKAIMTNTSIKNAAKSTITMGSTAPSDPPITLDRVTGYNTLNYIASAQRDYSQVISSEPSWTSKAP
jgi:hypothetical protein